jgi:predicted secreted hydrolase
MHSHLLDKTVFPLMALCAVIVPSTLVTGCAEHQSSPPPCSIRLPYDGGSHIGMETEWWHAYFRLTSNEGAGLDLAVSYFNKGMRIVSASDEGSKVFYFEQAPGRVTASPGPLNITWWSQGLLDSLVQSGEDESAYSLTSTREPFLPGGSGHISSAGGGSCSYALTRLDVSGTVFLLGKQVTVTGTGYLDHNWGMFRIASPWKYIAMRLDDGTDIIAVETCSSGGAPAYKSASVLRPDGSASYFSVFTLEETDSFKSAYSGNTYATAWRLAIPREGLDLELSASYEEKEITDTPNNYWEGGIGATGVLHGTGVNGTGFAQITCFR